MPTAPKPHLIKKYANRKLYDTLTSRYVTLEEIAQLVRDGNEIKVVDRDKGHDLTQVTLSQIVLSEEKQTPRAPGASGDAPHDRGQVLLDIVRRTLNVPAGLRTRVGQRRDDLEGIADEAIEATLTRLRIPSYRDIDRINRRLDELSLQLKKLGAPAPTGRTRGRKAAR
jgi:PHB/PHA accumulation regulator DNA-binding domain/Poly(hydroxyalcanoate) granule associated protein (phasin)